MRAWIGMGAGLAIVVILVIVVGWRSRSGDEIGFSKKVYNLDELDADRVRLNGRLITIKGWVVADFHAAVPNALSGVSKQTITTNLRDRMLATVSMDLEASVSGEFGDPEYSGKVRMPRTLAVAPAPSSVAEGQLVEVEGSLDAIRNVFYARDWKVAAVMPEEMLNALHDERTKLRDELLAQYNRKRFGDDTSSYIVLRAR